MADDDLHFSDDELQAALDGFEKEFESKGPGSGDGSAAPGDTGRDADGADADAPVADGHTADHQHTDAHAEDAHGTADSAGAQGGFDDELQELIGNKAKSVALVTRLASAELLAAFCQISDIAARCIGSDNGAVAVLKSKNGDAPEAAARDLTTVVSGMAVILAVNRADKLEATLYLQGEAGEQFAPPIFFASAPSFVEDLMLGIVSLDDLARDGARIFDTAAMDHDQAMAVIAKHTRFGRGKSSIQ